MDPFTLFWAITAFAFLLGSVIGSFLNVVVYRVPEGISIVSPPSRCPVCETPIRWYDNIPIVSWFVLGGECRHCGTSISVRYAVVEALTGILTAAVWYKCAAPTLLAATWPVDVFWEAILIPFTMQSLLVWALIAIAFVDLDTFLIPHEFTLPAIAVGLSYPWIMQWLVGTPHMLRVWPPVTPMMSLIGAIAGALSVVVIFYAYLAARGVEGLGGGDLTLMAVVGAWLGWPALIFVFFAASVQGLVAAGLTTLLGVNFIADSADVLADDFGVEEQGEDDDAADDADDESFDEEIADIHESPDHLVPEDDELVVTSDEEGATPPGLPAVPFGPFISLAAIEFLLLGPYLPHEVSLIYLYF